jgi:hypothetical protein
MCTTPTYSGMHVRLLGLLLGLCVAAGWIGRADADSFGPAVERWADSFCLDDETCRIADVNGDGKADVVAFVRSTQTDLDQGDVYVALSNGTSFQAAAARWQDLFCLGDEVCDVGDFNGDGKDDIVAFVRDPQPGAPPGQQGDVYVALSSGIGFGPSGVQWQEFFCIDGEICDIGDFNGDGKDDIVAFVQNTNSSGEAGDVYVALSSGTGFGPSGAQWQEFFCIGDRVCDVGDFNGDGRDDVVSFARSTEGGDGEGNVYVALSSGTSFSAGVLWQGFFCIGEEVCGVGDFNGDGKDDIVAFVRDTQSDNDHGDVYVALSSGFGFGSAQLWQDGLCFGGEVCRTGDVDGDGRDDAVVFVRDSRAGGERGDVLIARSTALAYLPARMYLPVIGR